MLGITGTGGAGKSSLTDELVRRLRLDQGDKLNIAVISIDPSRRKSGGALLGDRIRMNAIGPWGNGAKVYMRSLATREAGSEISEALPHAIAAAKVAGFDVVIVETSGIGQGDAAIVPHVDLSLYVMTPEYGAASQLEKIDMLDFADFVAINKFDRKGAADALRDVAKQVQRNKGDFTKKPDEMPVFGTMASRFNDDGVTALYQALLPRLQEHGLKTGDSILPKVTTRHSTNQTPVVPPQRTRYLAEISDTVRGYKKRAHEQARLAREIQQLRESARMLHEDDPERSGAKKTVERVAEEREAKQDKRSRKLLDMWPQMQKAYAGDEYVVKIRDRELRTKLTTTSLSGSKIRKVALPHYEDHGELLHWMLLENVPGSFPYTAGVFAFKRENEDPTRMFAGEGDSFRTNKRFKLLSEGMPAKRLSTAFDSVTLYGNDPDLRPDIYGKVGNSRRQHRHTRRPEGALLGLRPDGAEHVGVDDDQRPGADDPRDVHEHRDRPEPRQVPRRQRSRADRRRGREDPAMGARERARHRAGRHPEGRPGPEHLHLLDRVLAEGDGRHPGVLRPPQRAELLFGVDQRLSHRRGGREPDQPARVHAFQRLHVRRGVSRARHAHRRLRAEPELLLQQRHGPRVHGDGSRRAAHLVSGDARQVRREREVAEAEVPLPDSGRSLHAQEIQFNDIRTTLQALIATYDNANSLHTNAFDEAITTPTEDSVRRAMAIQMIINREWGLAKNENPNQGSFIIDELTELVEEAVLKEFESISERGGVLGAMELGYQRGKIQEESLHYEHLKHTGEYPIIGVNTFRNPHGETVPDHIELARSTEEEKQSQLKRLQDFQKRHAKEAPKMLKRLQQAVIRNENVFAVLMEAVRVCSLGQITNALFEVGGQYRRSM